jgi:hypothetical protein
MALFSVQIGKLAGGSEGRQAMNTGIDQVVDKARQHRFLDATVLVDG